MRWRDRIAKAFRLGPATVDTFETTYGHDQERYAPAAYGDYPATNAAVFACSNIRAKNLAKLHLKIYKRATNGERVEVTSGRLYDLMRSVNGYWTFRRLIRMTEMSLCTYGQAFWVLENGVEAFLFGELAQAFHHPERAVLGCREVLVQDHLVAFEKGEVGEGAA
ncbi:MAG: phage portal protein, partial [Terrimicrobiaceae bacterium]